jgi:hypothetical protein
VGGWGGEGIWAEAGRVLGKLERTRIIAKSKLSIGLVIGFLWEGCQGRRYEGVEVIS